MTAELEKLYEARWAARMSFDTFCEVLRADHMLPEQLYERWTSGQQPTGVAFTNRATQMGLSFDTFERRTWYWFDTAWFAGAAVHAGVGEPPKGFVPDDVGISREGEDVLITLFCRRGYGDPRTWPRGTRAVMPRRDWRVHMATADPGYSYDAPPPLVMAEVWPWFFHGLRRINATPPVLLQCRHGVNVVKPALEPVTPSDVRAVALHSYPYLFNSKSGRVKRCIVWAGMCTCRRIHWMLEAWT